MSETTDTSNTQDIQECALHQGSPCSAPLLLRPGYLLVVTHNKIYKVTQSKHKQKNDKLLIIHRNFRLKQNEICQYGPENH